MRIWTAHALRALALLIGASLLSGLAAAQNAHPEPEQALGGRVFVPLVFGAAAQPPSPPAGAIPTDWLGRVNAYRALVGAPPVAADPGLSGNCIEHARYMAENNDLTHEQNPALPFASAAGQICAGKGNAWIGSAFSSPIWTEVDAVDGWVGSVGHRLWLLYPTTRTMGFGFYTAANNRSGASLDVLSRANFSADTSYAGWPVRYPAPGQSGLPATPLPITLNWRYFGPSPTVSAVSLQTESGAAVPHSVSTDLDAGHKGIAIQPSSPLPNNTVFVVTVSGAYDGAPFSTTWRFATGTAQAIAEADQLMAPAAVPTP